MSTFQSPESSVPFFETVEHLGEFFPAGSSADLSSSDSIQPLFNPLIQCAGQC